MAIWNAEPPPSPERETIDECTPDRQAGKGAISRNLYRLVVWRHGSEQAVGDGCKGRGRGEQA